MRTGPEALVAGSASLRPPYAPYAAWLATEASFPATIERLQRHARKAALALPDGRALSFVAAPRIRPSALDYERRISACGEVAIREGSAHDLWNALAWLRFPDTKSALNALHVTQGRAPSGNGRAPCRDAATLLDESGVIVACADTALVALWRAHRWRAAFFDRRDDIARGMRVAAIGHGLLVKLAAPYPSITAAALVLPIDAGALPDDPSSMAATLDRRAARWLAARGCAFVPRDLLPLPLAALPGWCGRALPEKGFDDHSVFREGACYPRKRRQPPREGGAEAGTT